jgi:hypothetical protein
VWLPLRRVSPDFIYKFIDCRPITEPWQLLKPNQALGWTSWMTLYLSAAPRPPSASARRRGSASGAILSHDLHKSAQHIKIQTGIFKVARPVRGPVARGRDLG